MMHPPWLRFQAYVVGLPKTGSTSLATVFANYRTGHEVGMRELLSPGMAWRARELSGEQFWSQAGARLTRPSLEMDSATCHHLYADLLVDRYPKAVFIFTMRDVGSWVTSLLDMSLRYQMSRARLGIDYTQTELDYMALMSEGHAVPSGDPRAPDAAAVAPMMRFWADHMRRIGALLPPGRSLFLPTARIGDQLHELADLCSVPVATLRADLTHSNRAPRTLNRLQLHDNTEIRATYREYCADLMAQYFPQEHAAVFQGSTGRPDWETHCDEVERWVISAIERYGSAVAR